MKCKWSTFIIYSLRLMHLRSETLITLVALSLFLILYFFSLVFLGFVLNPSSDSTLSFLLNGPISFINQNLRFYLKKWDNSLLNHPCLVNNANKVKIHHDIILITLNHNHMHVIQVLGNKPSNYLEERITQNIWNKCQ